MRLLTRKKYQDDHAKMWSEAVEAECKALIESAVLAERAACLADVKKVFAVFETLPKSAEKKMLNSVTSIFIESIKEEFDLRVKS